MSNTTEPAALAGIEPVAWLNKKLPHMAVPTKPDDGGGWFPVYSATTVERLVQERDDWQRQSSNNWTSAVKNGLLLAAMTQERDEWKNDAINGGNAGYLRDQLAASQAREQQLREAPQEALADVSWGVNSGLSGLRDTERAISDVLSLLQDDTALRQWGAKLLREMADNHRNWSEVSIILRREADELEGK